MNNMAKYINALLSRKTDSGVWSGLVIEKYLKFINNTYLKADSTGYQAASSYNSYILEIPQGANYIKFNNIVCTNTTARWCACIEYQPITSPILNTRLSQTVAMRNYNISGYKYIIFSTNKVTDIPQTATFEFSKTNGGGVVSRLSNLLKSIFNPLKRRLSI